MTTPTTRVHLVFKTHFDFGFTDFAAAVVAQYFDQFIPQVLDSAEQARREGSAERIIWTTGAWLIDAYLEQADSQKRRQMEEAIAAGDIAWHGLPFTTHTELMDASLVRFGLEISRGLDRRFGKQTIAAKMTDVPGHTRALAPLLAEAGIELLHIGVNEAATPPDVPPIFVWQDDSGAEVIVMYQHAYGEAMHVPGMQEALAFGFTNDNLGPQTPAEISEVYDRIRATFPDAEVQASTLDAFAAALRKVKPHLPVITQEIGDTWIHGVGSDPGKVSRYRALCRLRNRWLSDVERSVDVAGLRQFSRCLLCVPEHTWGLDEKTHLADYERYGNEEFQAARREPAFQKMEASWVEQREYLDQAVAALPDESLADEARSALQELAPVRPAADGFETISDLDAQFETAHFILRFDRGSGALNCFIDKQSGRNWATPQHLLGRIGYQTFSQADYDRFLTQYLVRTPDWAIPDNSKPGIAQAGAESSWWDAQLSGLSVREDAAGSHFLMELAMPEHCATRYGCPRLFTLSIAAPNYESALHVDLQWFGKQACRLPEAIWFALGPCGADGRSWKLDKLGRPISPLDVVRNGNRKLHAVDRGVYYQDESDTLWIETFDAPLVAPGRPSLLDFNNTQPDLEGAVHFNLYNNVWGTNFPMWYEEDARFRFVIRLGRDSGRLDFLGQMSEPEPVEPD